MEFVDCWWGLLVPEGPTALALYAAGLSLVAKEALFHATIKVVIIIRKHTCFICKSPFQSPVFTVEDMKTHLLCSITIVYQVGKRTNSEVVTANAHHHRSDAGSSLVALVGIAGCMAGVPWLDSAAGLVR